jgi:porphobilinogen synthase
MLRGQWYMPICTDRNLASVSHTPAGLDRPVFVSPHYSSLPPYQVGFIQTCTRQSSYAMSDYHVPDAHRLHTGYHHPLLREWQRCANIITRRSLIYPIFVTTGQGIKRAISSLPNQYHWSVDRLHELLDPLVARGLAAVIIFGVPGNTKGKDLRGSLADAENGPVIPAIRLIRKRYPDLLVACDVCLCAYTTHGHCGILNQENAIDNAESIQRIAQVATAYARAGCQLIAPSDMMDGRIGSIKQALREAKLEHRTAVMSYSAKFASSFYGPFR